MRVVVTGANRGLGAEVARQLSEREIEVVGTSREPAAPWRLDLSEPASIAAFAASLDGLDVLINNAAVALEGFDERVASDTLRTNLHGTIALTEALLPKIRPGGRIVAVSSGMGELSGFSGQAREALASPTLDRKGVLALADAFVQQVARGTHTRQGWPSSAYSTSKALLNAYVQHLARTLEKDGRGIKVVAVCPGWVRTDLGGSRAPRSVEQGAEGIVWAATAPEVVSGRFYRDGKAIPW